jgi:DNA-binding XRE family transcriptional regulator
MMTADQLRGARAILRLDQKTLAKRADISVETIKRLERQNGPLQAHFDTIRRLKETLEFAGAEFDDGGRGKSPGVRLAVDQVAALIEQFTHHFVTAWNLAKEIHELTRNDPQIQVPPEVKSLLFNYTLTRSYQWRGRPKGGRSPRRRLS